MINLNSVTEHFYALIPNGKGYKVDWATKVGDGLYRAPACSDSEMKVVFGLFDTLEIALEKVKMLQNIQNTRWDTVIYERAKEDPYIFEPVRVV